MHLYERIFEDLKRSIDEGETRPGEKLPSIREVALRYGCNKITAQKAFDLLSEGGFVENRVGSGSYVTFPGPPAEAEGDFSAARLSEEFFPYEEAGSLLAGILARSRGQVFSASPTRGEAGLLAALSRRFSLPEASLLVTGGGLQGIDLCRRLFAGRPSAGGRDSAKILVEEPCFPFALSLFRPEASLPMGAEGPDPKSFADFFGPGGQSRGGGRSAVFYAVPDIHNPTGLRYSESTKRELSRLARDLEVWIVEDDYLSELEPSGIPRFVDLVPERTIWIKSLSRTTAPGIRLGALSAPASMRSRLESLKAEVDTGPAAWLQLFVAGLLSSGLHDRELEATAIAMKARRAELARILASFPFLSFNPASAGYNLWVSSSIPPSLALPPWAEGRRFGYAPELRQHFRLSFMSLGQAEWPRALGRLELALHRAFGGQI
jgi:DNA-binding transcriptional MocR family regulator